MRFRQISAEYAMTAQNVLNSPIVMRHETYLDTFPITPRWLKLYSNFMVLDESKIRFIFMKLFSQKRSKGEVNVYTEEGFKISSNVQQPRLSGSFTYNPLCGLQNQKQTLTVMNTKNSLIC